METTKLEQPKWYNIQEDSNRSVLIDEYFFDTDGTLFAHSIKHKIYLEDEQKEDRWVLDCEAKGLTLYDTYEELYEAVFLKKEKSYKELVEVLKDKRPYEIQAAYNATHELKVYWVNEKEYIETSYYARIFKSLLRMIKEIKGILNNNYYDKGL